MESGKKNKWYLIVFERGLNGRESNTILEHGGLYIKFREDVMMTNQHSPLKKEKEVQLAIVMVLTLYYYFSFDINEAAKTPF